MPVMSCTQDDKPGYKYGTDGKCYTYAAGNIQARRRAKRKAFLQGAAVEASKAQAANKSNYKVKEYDDSLNDLIAGVQAAFAQQFAGQYAGDPYNCFVTDVFDEYVIAREGAQGAPDLYKVAYSDGEDGSITFAAKDDWQPVRLSYVAELSGLQPVRDILVVSEFKGSYPDVPFADGVDIDALVDGDPDPVFVTLPVGKVNVRSGNKRFYDEAFVAELERQIIANRPVGLMGHLSPEARATEFPAEAIHWLGARRVGELLWAKGYLPQGEARARLKRYKASGKPIATSIDALAEGLWDDTLAAYRMQASTLQLAQIDIAPADRAGISDLAAVPHLTAEMAAQGNGLNSVKEFSMTKEEAIRALTPEDAKLLPESVRSAILAAAGPPAEVAQVKEIRAALGVDETTDLAKTITELKATEATRQAEMITRRITELAGDADKGIKIDVVRELVIEMVAARHPQSVQEAEAAYGEIIAGATVKRLLAAHVRETMGPPQRTSLVKEQESARYFVIPAAKEK